MIQMKRVYEEYSKEDGFRVLVDRLWPRGLTKERAHVDLWLKEIAPSQALRKWFGHEIEKWQQFLKRYREELTKNPGPLAELTKLQREHKMLTLLYGAKNEERNQAVALLGILKAKK